MTFSILYIFFISCMKTLLSSSAIFCASSAFSFITSTFISCVSSTSSTFIFLLNCSIVSSICKFCLTFSNTLLLVIIFPYVVSKLLFKVTSFCVTLEIFSLEFLLTNKIVELDLYLGSTKLNEYMHPPIINIIIITIIVNVFFLSILVNLFKLIFSLISIFHHH